jgi:hypothetical protein
MTTTEQDEWDKADDDRATTRKGGKFRRLKDGESVAGAFTGAALPRGETKEAAR